MSQIGAVDVQRQRHMNTSEKQKPAEAGFFWPFRIPFDCRPGDGRSSWSWARPALQSGCRL